MTAIVDPRFEDIQIVRPLRNISEKEIEIFHRLQETENLFLNQTSRDDEIFENGIQTLCSKYINSLQNGGFPSTIETILSISSKIDSKNINDAKCQICLCKFILNNGERNCCMSCENVLNELNLDLKKKIFKATTRKYIN